MHRRLSALQHRAASALGVDEAKRMETVVAMLANNARRVPGYWIQLFLSMGIATLGLVLDSTAVVIGAMLVSPLMGPILELGMGFAVGSSLLVLQAAFRVVMSVVVVVTGAALLVLALPFHEITHEIATRVAPTALDLLVAVFCALTAGYTTVRPGSDTTAAAAGTAIGIALVPPLGTVGFGLGTGALDVAGGAALLFTANLSAILVLAVLSFLLLGFNQVNAAVVERDFLAVDGPIAQRWARNAHRALGSAFGSRYGLAMRVLIPALFLAAVFVPLRRALDEVSWEVRARDAVRRIVQEESPHAIQTAVVVDRHALSLRLFTVGSATRAADLERRIIARVRRATGVTPEVAVVAVPGSQQLLATAAAAMHAPSPAPEEAPTLTLRQRVADAVSTEWPAAAGPLLRWEMTVSATDSISLRLSHLGEPLSAVAATLLSRAISARLAAPVAVVDAPIPATVLTAAAGRQTRWMDSTRVLLSIVASSDSVMACVRGPIAPSRRTTARDRAVAKALQATEASRRGRLVASDADRWQIRLAVGSCSDGGPLPSIER